MAVGAAVHFRELDGFVDHHAVRHLQLTHELVTSQKKNPALDGRKLYEAAIQKRCNPFLELPRVVDCAVQKRAEVPDVALREILGFSELGRDHHRIGVRKLPLV